jgi:hypothetical protein
MSVSAMAGARDGFCDDPKVLATSVKSSAALLATGRLDAGSGASQKPTVRTIPRQRPSQWAPCRSLKKRSIKPGRTTRDRHFYRICRSLGRHRLKRETCDVSASASEGVATAFVVLKGGLTLPLAKTLCEAPLRSHPFNSDFRCDILRFPAFISPHLRKWRNGRRASLRS